MSEVSVFLVDDHELFLTGVRTELAERFEVAGSASDVDEAIAGILRTAPDVLLIDVHMPGGGGVSVSWSVRRLFAWILLYRRREWPDVAFGCRLLRRRTESDSV